MGILPWKNELALQLERVLLHCAEIVDDSFEGAHNPHHMLERALALSAFCVRRMVEKRLVTDKFANTKFEVRTFQAVTDGGFRMPFHYSAGGAGGGFFRNYEISKPKMVCVKTITFTVTERIQKLPNHADFAYQRPSHGNRLQ